MSASRVKKVIVPFGIRIVSPSSRKGHSTNHQHYLSFMYRCHTGLAFFQKHSCSHVNPLPPVCIRSQPLSCSDFRMACWWTPLTTGSWIFSLPSSLQSFMLTPKEGLLALQLFIISIGTILHCKFITHIHYLIRNLDTFSSSSQCIIKFQGSEKTLHLDFLFSPFEF